MADAVKRGGREMSQSLRHLERALAWALLGVVVAVALVGLLRYGLDMGWVWMQEGYLWLNAAVVLLAMTPTMARDRHVRVDLLYRNYGDRGRAIVDILSVVLLLWPLLGVVLWTSFPYVQASWSVWEGSREAGGLPGLFLLKSMLPLAAVLLLARGLATVLCSWRMLRVQ